MATLEIYNLDDSFAMSVLKRGLCTFRINFSLDKKTDRSYSKVLLRAEKYIHVKEGANARHEIEEKSSTKKVRGDSRPTPTNKLDPPHPCSPRRPRNPVDRPSRDYTPLLVPPSKILMEIESEEYLRRPPPMRSDTLRNRNKFCRFHHDHDHDMDECH